jgi:hypothetical protein
VLLGGALADEARDLALQHAAEHRRHQRVGRVSKA